MSVPTYMIHAIDEAGDVDCVLPCFRDLGHAKNRADNLLKWDALTKCVKVYACNADGEPISPQRLVYRSQVPF